MRHHDSDHWALVMRVKTDPAGVKRYEKNRRPLAASLLPRPLSRGDAMLAELVEAVEKPPVKERSENVGVRSGTWSLVDRRAELRKAGRLTQRELRRRARVIRASLKLDRQERAQKAGEAIMMELLAGNIKEAWRILKAWHWEAGGAATTPCHASMERKTVEREELYYFQASLGEHTPANRDPILLLDDTPSDKGTRTAVNALRIGRTGGGSMIQAEDLKGWLQRAAENDAAEAEGTLGLEGAGDICRLLARLIRNIWDTREIPFKMLLTSYVIPKGNSGCTSFGRGSAAAPG